MVRLQPGTVPSYTVDVADFEQVAPAPEAPQGSVSVLDTGADPTGAEDSAAAFTAAIEQARAAGTEVCGCPKAGSASTPRWPSNRSRSSAPGRGGRCC
ncbi:hypothetical protein GCM10020366_70320 [Saccharopolyspora gregorii]|uniref:Uncharacterized protein n=1 Tax=Saccharopolyspora gregorii TaxID=33914 RepID=A0ABP6S2L6_9PSEU